MPFVTNDWSKVYANLSRRLEVVIWCNLKWSSWNGWGRKEYRDIFHFVSHLWPVATWTRFVYAFDDEIRAAVEGAITSAIISGARKLDTFLLELPRSLPIDDISAIDVTVVEDPFVSPTFLSAGVKGEFISLKKPTVPLQPDHSLPPGIFCSESAKMITIAVCDYVINSAAKVYFEVHCSLLELIMLLPLVFCFLHFREPLGSSWTFSDFAHIPSCTLLFCSVVTFFRSFIFVNLLISLSSWGCP